MDELPPNRIVDFFSGKTILVTGATGFLGKVLIEKLLRSCTPLRKIYVLIRERKGRSAQERLREILNGPLYDRARQEHGPDVVEKVEAVSGDVSCADLGLSPTDRSRLLEETQIVYHSAASVKFDDPLRGMVLLNVRGTKLMLELAKECKKLLVFCYVSTAYCHEDQEVLVEKFYPSETNPHDIIKLCGLLNEENIDCISKQLRGINVNNYTFTKALSEALVEEQEDALPVIVQRPSVVVPMWREPIPGWTDNLNGPIGLCVGGGKGVIRTMYAREDIFVDAFPVDIIANGLITSAYDFCKNRTRRIYNLTASELTSHLGITAKKIVDCGLSITHTKIAFSQVLWSANISLTQSRALHYVAFVLFQLLPALIVDGFLCVVGVKPFLLRVQKKVWKGYQVFEYYANRKWNFRNDNVLAAQNELNSTEKEMFKYDVKEFDLYEYLIECTLGSRRYVMKEPDDDIPAALKRMKMLRYLDIFCKSLLVAGLIYYIFSKWMPISTN